MDSELGQPRLGAASAIMNYLDPSFLVIPPTVKFPYPVVAHNDLGFAALIIRDGIFLYDGRIDRWIGNDTLDTNFEASELAIDLAAAARAPSDRVTAVTWLPDGRVGDYQPDDGTIASQDPEQVAQRIMEIMQRRLSGSSAPTSPWAGTYAASAFGPRDRMTSPFQRLIAAIEMSLKHAVGDAPIVCYGHEMSVEDLVDPYYLLPALVIAAAEDWYLPTRRRTNGTGFSAELDEDPTSLLGYRLVNIRPAIPFTALAPIIATLRRSKEGDEYVIDDIVHQFARWLKKNGMDARVLDDVEVRVATSG